MKKIKKKELLKRIEALEAIVDDLQKDSEKAEGLGEKKELKVDKWCCVSCGSYSSNSGVDAIIFYDGNDRSYGFNHEGEWTEMYLTSKDSDFIKDFKREATPQEVEEALIKEAKKRYKVGVKLRPLMVPEYINDFSSIDRFSYDGRYLSIWGDLTLTNDLNYQTTHNGSRVIVFQNGKWAEVVEKQQYTPKIGDVVKAWMHSGETIIGILNHVDGSKVPYRVSSQWFPKIETITDENIIKLFR